MSRWGSAIVAFLTACLIASPAQSSILEYWYVAANVGSSSGGHVAIRFGDQVYHFQHHAPGILRLARSSAEHFRYVYGVLGNRTIQVARIQVSHGTYERLLDRFNERYLIEAKQFALLESLGRERRLLGHLLAHTAPAGPASLRELPAPFRLEAAGLFDWGAPPERTSSSLSVLRNRLRGAQGEGFLRTKIAELTRGLWRLQPPLEADATMAVGNAAYPRAGYRFSDRYADMSLQLLALRALQRALPLRPETRRWLSDEGFLLTAEEQRKLRAFRDALLGDLVKLVRSGRPDWGFALLVGMARLELLDETLRSGRFVFLDAFPDDVPTIPGAGPPGRTPFLLELRDHARREFDAARTEALASGAIRERDFNLLEEASNRLVEVERGLSEGRPIRVHADTLVPSRSSAALDLPAPQLGWEELLRAEATARESERSYAAALNEIYGYNLVTRNCASEIFVTLDGVLDREASISRLGGHIDPGRVLNFVPIVSFRAVLDAYDVVAVGELPSYRRARLEEMYATERAIAVFLREANTLSSTVYRANDEDSFFLFFTDDAIAPRPLLGVFNVAAGLGELLLGVLRSPLDGGRTAWSGAKGVFFSLPELAFVNIRKGTMAYGPGEVARTSRPLGVPAQE